jgi:hypothetical protein
MTDEIRHGRDIPSDLMPGFHITHPVTTSTESAREHRVRLEHQSTRSVTFLLRLSLSLRLSHNHHRRAHPSASSAASTLSVRGSPHISNCDQSERERENRPRTDARHWELCGALQVSWRAGSLSHISFPSVFIASNPPSPSAPPTPTASLRNPPILPTETDARGRERERERVS